MSDIDPLAPLDAFEFLGWDVIIRQQVSGPLECVALKGVQPVVRLLVPAGMDVAAARLAIQLLLTKRVDR